MDPSMLTLRQLFLNTLTHNSEKTALVFQGKTVTYQQLLKTGNRIARALNKRGIKTIALLMSNCSEYVMCDIGVNLAGCTKVPLNDMLGEKEIKYILQDSESEAIIVGENFIEMLTRIQHDLPKLKTIIAVTSRSQCPEGMLSWETFLSSESDQDLHVDVKPEDRALLIYTGGTTGLPKGVVHSQANLAINLISHVIETEMREDEKILLMSPLPHSAGVVLQTGLLKGATHFIEKGFDAQLVLERIERDKITFTFMVPTMIYRVMDQIKGSDHDFSSLRTILYGAAPIAEKRLQQGLSLFGSVFMQLYGQTEAPNFVTRLKKSDHLVNGKKAKRLRSCGQPVLMSQVKIVTEDGQEAPAGVAGEIAAKTPYNMIEYHNKPDKTAETLKNGWLHTGDIGMKDEDGYIYLLDRKKDMIISGGMNVYTTEVENVIQTHPDVSQNAVIGVPHPDWGETVVAIVVPKKGIQPSEESISNHCKKELSKYKCPKDIHFVDAMPLTPYGKIDKKALRKLFGQDES